MCSLCDDGGEYCQDCGALICFDVKHGDDILRRAYVTSSGDLFCDRCGSRHDAEEEEESYAMEYDGFEYDEEPTDE